MRCAGPGAVPIQRAYAPTSSLTTPTSSALDGRIMKGSPTCSGPRLQLPRDRVDTRAAGEDRAERDDPRGGDERALPAIVEPLRERQQAAHRHHEHAVLLRERTAEILRETERAAEHADVRGHRGGECRQP